MVESSIRERFAGIYFENILQNRPKCPYTALFSLVITKTRANLSKNPQSFSAAHENLREWLELPETALCELLLKRADNMLYQTCISLKSPSNEHEITSEKRYGNSRICMHVESDAVHLP